MAEGLCPNKRQFMSNGSGSMPRLMYRLWHVRIVRFVQLGAWGGPEAPLHILWVLWRRRTGRSGRNSSKRGIC